ncbi:hypothetical protein BDV26DRAFT_172114 [Aspergillus bertholletiae]|uniref:Uncharacterized protein n=1 Tax=Aspergillus bertholletiae TaxID=1226010 RepID=A0A5N7BC43_9EURO|nr:hypothetical protein BDV26DRAFT_172114 [Aspergillus bertholletiae]
MPTKLSINLIRLVIRQSSYIQQTRKHRQVQFATIIVLLIDCGLHLPTFLFARYSLQGSIKL